MIEIAIAVFLGLVLFAAFGAQTARGLQLAAVVGLRTLWGPTSRLLRWCARAIGIVAIPAGVAIANATTGRHEDATDAMLTGALVGGVIGLVVGGSLEIAGRIFAKVDRLVHGETPGPSATATPPRPSPKGIRVTIECGSCGARNDQDAAFCKGCGQRLEVVAGPGMKVECGTCRTVNDHDATFCKGCGTGLQSAT